MGNIEEKNQKKYVQVVRIYKESPKSLTNKQNRAPLVFPPLNKLQVKAIFHKTSPIKVQESETPQPEDQPTVVQQPSEEQDIPNQPTLLQKVLTSELKTEGKIQVQWNLFTKIKKKCYLQDYVFVKEIGKGAFGQVIKAKMKFGTQNRAIKLIKQSMLLRADSCKQKILAQISVPIQLDHPNIGKIYEVFQWKQSFGIVMELCEGGDLFAYIKNQRNFTEASAASLFKQIISGVYYMHKHNVCHRDLKPQNMLYDNDSRQLKIIDFGTAVRVSKQAVLNEMAGSMYYVAPQVLLGCYNQLCDVWSCGVILYIILCGFPPFQGKNEKQIKEKVLYNPVQFNHPIWLKRTSQSKELISKMLAKDPKKRITAEQVLNCPWFQKILRESLGNNEISGQVLSNLKNFCFKNKLKAVVYTFIASQLYSNKDKENLLKVFKQMDKDGDGVIEKQELINAFHTTQSPLTNVQIERILSLIDTNASGKIDFTQFLVAASNEEQMLKKKQLEAAFSYLDSDHSGYITIQQVKTFLDGTTETQQQIKQIFKEVDQNGDGKISKNEFIALLLGHQESFTAI